MKSILYRFSRKREKGTDYDGFLSYAGEWHALVIGIGVGGYAGVEWLPGLAFGLVALAFGIKTGSGGLARVLAKVGKADEKASVLGELRREPWYTAGGDVAAFVIFGAATHGPDKLLDVVSVLL